jgi:hypothetical protein
MFTVFIWGSKVKRIASEIACDVLIVPESPGAEVTFAESWAGPEDNKNSIKLQ